MLKDIIETNSSYIEKYLNDMEEKYHRENMSINDEKLLSEDLENDLSMC